MFKNYLKVAWRNLLNNKLYAFINIFGLAVAVAWSVVAYLNHTYNYTFDSFHKNADQIFRVKTVRLFNGQERSWGVVPRPLGPAMAADFPAVERTVRLTRSEAVFRLGEKIFNETVLHTDPAFFEMFDFPLKYGQADGLLRDNSKIVLSEELAHKYFGDDNPIGKLLTLRYGNTPREFIVGAVAEKIPDNSSIQFDALACFNYINTSIAFSSKRLKEIGIRKVVGASVTNMTAMLSKDFVKLVLLANLIAWPLAWFAMNKWLENFAYRIEIGWWVFVLAGGLALVIALLIVSTQAIRAALANPVEALRYE